MPVQLGARHGLRFPSRSLNAFTLASSARASSSLTPSASSSPHGSGQALHLVLLGAPGAGKGTQTDSLLRKYDMKTLVVGNLLRDEVARKTELGKRAAQVMKAGGLLDDETILGVVKPGLRKLDGADWILDGYPRTARQASDLNEALAEQNASINLVVNLDVPDEVLIERIEARWVHLPSGRVYNTTYNPPKTPGLDDITGEKLIKRMDDKPEIFQKRLDQFHKENDPIKAFYESTGALVNLYGRTSAEIWPQLEQLVNKRFPHVKAKEAIA